MNSILIVGIKADGKEVRRTMRGIGYGFQARVDSWIARGYVSVKGYPSSESTGKAFETVRAFGPERILK